MSPDNINLVRDTIQLYPYLDENGLYGYANKQMETAIPPKYSSASLFTSTGFAVVSEAPKPVYLHRNHYGVINQIGEPVVPFEHQQIHLEVLNGYTVIWTKQVYLNRWRFWEWGGILFGDNFFSGAKLIDTEVWRSKIQVGILESSQLINKKRAYELTPPLEILSYEPVDSICFLQGNQLYQLQEGKAVSIAENIYGKTSNGLFLQQRGFHYRLIGRDGEIVPDAQYEKRKSLDININGKSLLFSVNDISKIQGANGNGQTRFVFKDKKNRQYLFPDFETPFPGRVDALVEGNVAVDTVLNRSRLTPGASGSGRFYFRWKYLLAEKRIFEVNESGIWMRYSQTD